MMMMMKEDTLEMIQFENILNASISMQPINMIIIYY